MIYAIVDLGSNTIRLCVYEYSGGNVKSIFERKTMAGLANYVKNEKLSKDGINKACEVLKDYGDILTNFQLSAESTHVFATASLRNIVNTKEVISIINEETGYKVELLSGEEEATLDFMGATRILQNENGILVDIGGGSTEIVVFKNREIKLATSMPIGSLNLYVKYVKKIIPKEEERETIRQAVFENLEALEIPREEYETICGVGGTMRAAAKLGNNIFGEKDKTFILKDEQVKEMLSRFKNNHKDILTPILQNIPDRIHTIIPGLIVVETVMDYFNSENIIVSKYGIREGYLYERIIKGE